MVQGKVSKVGVAGVADAFSNSRVANTVAAVNLKKHEVLRARRVILLSGHLNALK